MRFLERSSNIYEQNPAVSRKSENWRKERDGSTACASELPFNRLGKESELSLSLDSLTTPNPKGFSSHTDYKKIKTLNLKIKRFYLGGRRGIRTLEMDCSTYTLSKRASSATRAPFRQVTF
jgi:hypothetical protein